MSEGQCQKSVGENGDLEGKAGEESPISMMLVRYLTPVAVS